MLARLPILVSLLFALVPISARGQDTQRAPLPASGQAAMSPQQLDDLTARIALYPDAMVAQILLCAQSPYQIRQVNTWLHENPTLKGSELQDAADAQGFDSEFVAMVLFPDVLTMMADDEAWTTQLGNAFSTNKDAVFDSIQRLRAKAKQLGNLESNDQQKVVVQAAPSGQQVIVIEPANPQIIYVPQYNPQVVYVSPAPTYVSTGYSSGTVVAAGAIGFAAGVIVGAAINDDWHGGWGWHGGCCYSGGWNSYYDHQENMYKQYQKGRTNRTELRQDGWTERQGNRQDSIQDRQGNANDRQGNRQDNAQNRQGNRQDGAQNRQGNAQNNAQNRQGNRQDGAQNRQSQWGQNGGYNNTRGRTQQGAQSSQLRSGAGNGGAFSGYQNGASQRAASSRGNQSLNRSSYGSRSRSSGGAARGGGGRRR